MSEPLATKKLWPVYECVYETQKGGDAVDIHATTLEDAAIACYNRNMAPGYIFKSVKMCMVNPINRQFLFGPRWKSRQAVL